MNTRITKNTTLSEILKISGTEKILLKHIEDLRDLQII